MPRTDIAELALTTTLLSIYLGARGTARAIGMVQSVMPAQPARGGAGRT